VFVESGQITIAKTSIANNSAVGAFGIGDFGGLIGGSGTAGFGGGMYVNGGVVIFTQCPISGNSVTGGSASTGSHYGGGGGEAHGGGIWSIGDATLMNCTVSANTTRGGNGGDGWSYTGGPGGDVDGAGIWSGGNLVLFNCTVSGNTCQAGNGGSSSFAYRGGSGGSAYGGGLYANVGTSSVTSCTFYTNAASAGTGGTGSQRGWSGSAFGFGISGTTNTVTLRNTIVQKYSGAFSSAGHNLFEVRSNLVPSDVSIPVLALGALQNNGGPTATHALQFGDPAIDAGDDSLAGTDQRGRQRPSGAHVDIGAFEFQTPTQIFLAGLRLMTNGTFHFTFTNLIEAVPNVIASTDVGLSPQLWWDLGPATRIATNGVYEFTDPGFSNNPQRFFQLRWP
jgi:hypothetical protein